MRRLQLTAKVGPLGQGKHGYCFYMGEIDWGDAPTWLAGVFAAFAAYYTRGTLKSQQKQIDEQRTFIGEQAHNLHLERQALLAAAEDRRWEQARQVHFRALVTKSKGGTGPGGVRLRSTAVWVGVVTNSSQAPISNVRVTFGGEAAVSVMQEKPIYESLTGEGCTIPSGGLCTFESERGEQEFLDACEPILTFTDIRGVTWHMDRFDKISPIEGS